MIRKFCFISLLFVFLIPSYPEELFATNPEQYSDLKIFYSAFPSSFISPKIADSHQIIQSKNLGLVNIVGLNGFGDYVPLTIEGHVKNIFQQKQSLEFDIVHDSGGLYYLASFSYENEDFLTFNIWIRPHAATQKHQIKFQKIMYID
tara:strand:- start:141 stop:581 length:441 start_codon:yes stop_codon:yes gene_type:complete